MDAAKKAAFVAAKNRQKFAKGGAVRRKLPRKRFDEGGDVTALGGPGDTGVHQDATNPNTGLMGNINAALGLNNNFQAQGADIQPGTNTAQLQHAYTGAQDALGNQQTLINTFLPGAGQAQDNQRILGNQYLDMTQGQGPNPALEQLRQATGQNVQNQAALMAGQRGSGANAGLIARLAAQQGASTQQNAVGQAATLQAQQQIAAQQNLANLSSQQASQAGQAITGMSSAQQNEQALLQNANSAANNAAVGMQSNMNNVNSQTAAANQNMAANTLGGMMSAASSISSLFAKGGQVNDHLMLAEMNTHALQHAKKYAEGGEVDEPDLGSFKSSSDSASSPSIGSTAALPADQTDFSKAMQGGGKGGGSGGGGGGGGGLGSMIGMVAALADGGQIQANPLLMSQGPAIGGGGGFGSFQAGSGVGSSGPNIAGTAALPHNTEQFSKDVKDAMKKKPQDPNQNSPSHKETDDEALQGYQDADVKLGVSGVDNREDELPASNDTDFTMSAYGGKLSKGPHQSHVANFLFASGGKVPALVSPGEIYLSPEKVEKVLREGVDPKKIGEKIPGKAKVKGDSYSNDTVPRTLDEGGVVIDRKNIGSKEKRELFVHKAIAKKKAGRRS